MDQIKHRLILPTENCARCDIMGMQSRPTVVRYCPKCDDEIHLCDKHRSTTTTHYKCENKNGIKRKYPQVKATRRRNLKRADNR